MMIMICDIESQWPHIFAHLSGGKRGRRYKMEADGVSTEERKAFVGRCVLLTHFLSRTQEDRHELKT